METSMHGAAFTEFGTREFTGGASFATAESAFTDVVGGGSPPPVQAVDAPTPENLNQQFAMLERMFGNESPAPTAAAPVLMQASLVRPATQPMDSSRMLIGLMSLARQASLTHADQEVDIISRSLLRRMLSALHFRDVSTVRHSRRVATLAVGVGQFLGWDGQQLKALEIASLMHDIGKIGVPDNILFKPGKLNPDEADLMALHHKIAIDVLQICGVDAEVSQIVSQAHHHYNGAANGLERVGSNVHLGARILAVVDAYDSLATDQVYRDGKPHEEVMAVLMESAGTQFDGNIICVLQRWLERSGLPFNRQTGEYNTGDRPPGPADPQEALEASELGHILSHLYLLENLYDGFYLVDVETRCRLWSSGVEELLGHAAHAMLGQTWSASRLPHREPNGRILADAECPLLDVVRQGRAMTSSVEVRHANGSWVAVELQSVPLVDETGRVHGVLQIFRDMKRDGRKDGTYRDLKLAASQDALTHIANRSELESQLHQMVVTVAASEDQSSLSVMFLDVDFFKKINDNHGHAVGDAVLIDLAKLLQLETYSGELVGRYGGEEFVVLCPDTELEQAHRRAERLRIAVCDAAVGGLKVGQTTVSIGVSEFEPGDAPDSLIRRADKALYQAKESGRNRVVRLSSTDPEKVRVAESAAEQDPKHETFRFQATFAACVAADMVVYKLGGFVNDTGAKLIEVTPTRATVQLGARGLLPFWGSSDAKRPVRVQIDFGPQSNGDKRAVSRMVPIQVTVHPLGWARNMSV
ncbi:MAG: diguanylate cyclase, partial [Planctomycetota bacterium]|nr:diguanylate cyclase [Planctomycetota bacterium]